MLEGQGQAFLAVQKYGKASHCTDTHCLEGQRQAFVSRLETQEGTTATHLLEGQGQALSAV